MRPICLYFTTGDFGGQDSQVRNREAIEALRRLGVGSSQIFFVGEEQGISDGKLHLHLEAALDQARRIVSSLDAPVRTLHCPAWEGGHQDHDAVNLLTRVLAKEIDCSDVWQAPFYHGCGLPGMLFKVLSPLPANGPLTTLPISPADRIRYLGMASVYKSQTKTWVALLPFVVLDYLLGGQQKLQSVRSDADVSKPHEGALLYERRNFCRYDEFEGCAREFVRKHMG